MDATKLIEDAEHELGMWFKSAGTDRTASRLRLIIDLIAALKASEERARKAEELATANLAANKRIVELEHERDAARAELAQPSICPNCTAKMRRLDRMDSAGHAAHELDKARKDAAGQNKRAQKAEQEAKGLHAELMQAMAQIKELRAELARLTAPRPIAEAPRKSGSQIIALWMDGDVVESMDVVVWADMDDGDHPERKFWMNTAGDVVEHMTHYLPLPEVKP